MAFVCGNSLEFDGAMSGKAKMKEKTNSRKHAIFFSSTTEISMAIICSDPFRFDRKNWMCTMAPCLVHLIWMKNAWSLPVHCCCDNFLTWNWLNFLLKSSSCLVIDTFIQICYGLLRFFLRNFHIANCTFLCTERKYSIGSKATATEQCNLLRLSGIFRGKHFTTFNR